MDQQTTQAAPFKDALERTPDSVKLEELQEQVKMIQKGVTMQEEVFNRIIDDMSKEDR